LNGVYLVSVPITTILFSIDFNTNSNGNINGKYFHIDYIDIMDPSVSLPIELLFFSAIINDGKGELMWATESEINNDYFLIERSKDAEEWVEVITTKGSGNSNMVNGYFEIDNEPLMGVFYYRLTQVNFNGEKEIFNIVPVENITNGEGVMDIFPNPLTKGDCINLLFKNIDCIGNQEILVVLRDIKGKEVYSKIEIVDCDDGLIAIDIAGNLPSGAYLVIATSNNILYSKKVIIKDSIKK